MENTKRKLWIPILKSISDNGEVKYTGILSDTSIDRDDELIGGDLIRSWAKSNNLPALVNHENKMEKWVGGWKNIRAIEKGNNVALMADPFFFSKEANPLAAQVKKQIEEAIEHGLNPGISISAIPKSDTTIEKSGKKYRVWTEAELLEGTWVPIQSNRNASFGHIAKSFDIGMEKESTEISKPSKENLTKEEITMTEETKKQDEVVEKQPEVANVPEDAKQEEKPVEKPKEESKEEVKEEPKDEESKEEPKKESEEELKSKIAELQKQVAELSPKEVSKETKEEKKEVADLSKAPQVDLAEEKKSSDLDEALTIEKMLKMNLDLRSL